MKIVFTLPAASNEEKVPGFLQNHPHAIRVSHAREFVQHPDADLFVDGAFEGFFAPFEIPLLFHGPALPFSLLPEAPPSTARFCAWPGFLERETLEMAIHPQATHLLPAILDRAGIKTLVVPDVAGLIAPRILCTLINEALFTLADETATASAIDIAMKLGTNYPLGPIEWAKKIGAAEISAVLNAMAQEDKKYLPHELLQKLDDI